MSFRTYTCPISRHCGGCEWLAVPYPIQLRRKQSMMEELLGPVAGRDGARLGRIHGMEEPVSFRHKAATPFSPTRGGAIRSGFYAAGTHRIVDCDACLVEDPRARPILNDVACICAQVGIHAYQEDRGRGILRHAVVRCGYATDDILLTLVTNGQQLPRSNELVEGIVRSHPEVTSIVQNVNQRRTNAILGRECRTLFGPGVMHDKLLGCTFEIGPTSFYQTNPRQTEVLYALAVEAAGLRGGERVLDAYCGTGTIGICAAAATRRRGAEVQDVRVIGVERVGDAVACARRNATANGLGGSCSFVREDATAFMRKAAGCGEGRFDVVFMDPPRAGSTPAFIHGVAGLAPHRVVYISCNPTTQARDLKEFQQLGYAVSTVELVDMFPHTKHVETIALMTRNGGEWTRGQGPCGECEEE